MTLPEAVSIRSIFKSPDSVSCAGLMRSANRLSGDANLIFSSAAIAATALSKKRIEYRTRQKAARVFMIGAVLCERMFDVDLPPAGLALQRFSGSASERSGDYRREFCVTKAEISANAWQDSGRLPTPVQRGRGKRRVR